MSFNYVTTDTENNDYECEITFEKISDEDDIYLIQTEDKTYQLHRKKLLKSLRLLHEHCHVPIVQLQPNISDRFNSTIESIKLLYGSKELKKLVLNDIKDIYGNVKHPIPGTVGAFFVGCIHDSKFMVPLECNPTCGAGFDCSDTVLVYNGEFKTLNNKTTTNAYIFIKDDNFKRFDHYDIRMLKEAGIQSYILIFSNEDGSYKKVSKKKYINHEKDESQNWQVALIIVVILIALMLAGAFFMYKYNYIDIKNLLY